MKQSLDDLLRREKQQPIPQLEGLNERVWLDIGRRTPANLDHGPVLWRKVATISGALALGLAVGVGAAAAAASAVRPDDEVFAFGSRIELAPSSLLEVAG